ncbi:hypothetical protein DFH06DRAFT_1119601 [Mycena polygramma]|nr:hypothetical protein DFH06DRAFT_1119601 [Mycena polygramma]
MAKNKECDQFLMDAVPLPLAMERNCPSLNVHSISICKGATRATREDLARYTVHNDFMQCPPGGGRRCPTKKSERLPQAAQDMLRTLFASFKRVLQDKEEAEEGSTEHRKLQEEYTEILRRRDVFAQQLSAGEFALGKSAKRVAADLVEEEPVRQAKKVKRQHSEVRNRLDAAPREVEVTQDKYDPQLYELDPDQSRDITVIVYCELNTLPLTKTVRLRHAGRVELSSLDFAAEVKGVTVGADLPIDYEWFCIFEKAFLPGAFSEVINMLNRGDVLVCRSATLVEDECPGLQHYITKLYESVATTAITEMGRSQTRNSSASSLPFNSITSPSSSATTSSSSKVASSSQTRSSPVASSSRLPFNTPYMAAQTQLLEEEDEEDRRMVKFEDPVVKVKVEKKVKVKKSVAEEDEIIDLTSD